MKKTHRWLSVFVSVALAFAVAGCQIDSDRHEHSFSKDWTSNATDHWHAATCEHTKEVSGKTAHIFAEWKTTVEATEETEGKKERICSVCLYKEEQSLAKLDHTHKFSSDWTSDATDHWHAATCGHAEEVSEKAKHTFGDWTVTKEATEEVEGSRERSCTVCGYTATEAIEKLAHTHKFATAWTKDETNHWHAATCEHTTEVSGKAAHTFGDWTVTKEATCTKNGERKTTCTICGYEKTEVSGKAEHSFGDYVSNNDATTEADGTKTRECSVCGYKDTVTDEGSKIHVHTFAEEWTSDASGHWHAAACGHIDEKSGFAEHSFGVWKVVQEPTDTQAGRNERTCKYCVYVDSVVLQSAPEGFVFVKGGTVVGAKNSNNYAGVFIEGRTVTLSDFYMGKYEVTQEEYASVMEGQKVTVNGTEYALESNPSDCTADSIRYILFNGDVQEKRPVEGVTWYDAVWYCNALSEKEGLTKAYNIEVTTVNSSNHITAATVTLNENAKGYRLPTEAEWEYAARGGDSTKDDWNYVFSGAGTAEGVSYNRSKNAGLDSVGWYWYNSVNGTTGDIRPSSGSQGYGTHQVGKKAHNRLGLYDMSGNVWEWCYDWYGTITTTTPADGATSGSSRVNRGGGWGGDADYASVSRRGSNGPYNRSDLCGFRVVRASSN